MVPSKGYGLRSGSNCNGIGNGIACLLEYLVTEILTIGNERVGMKFR